MASKRKQFNKDWEFSLLVRLLSTLIILVAILIIHSNPSLMADFFSKVHTVGSQPFEIKKTLPDTALGEAVSPSPVYSKTFPVSNNKDPWGVAKQVSEHIWTIKLGQDSTMATAQDILTALNNYRARYGSQPLKWDNKLGNYAQSRADFFNSKGDLDSHVGFEDFLNNQDGFSKLGYNSVGENSSIGYKLVGVHLIEWVYAGDPAHDSNQKDRNWDHVGIGVSGTATDLIFATSPR